MEKEALRKAKYSLPSEHIRENVLTYASVPGQQKGCVDLMEATGGKA